MEPTYIPPSPPLLVCPTMLIPRKFTVSAVKNHTQSVIKHSIYIINTVNKPPKNYYINHTSKMFVLNRF